MVTIWANGKQPIPPKRCVLIERVTAGELTRQKLRPDDWPDHWPELADASRSLPSPRWRSSRRP